MQEQGPLESPVDIVSFDVWNTLLRRNPLFKSERSKIIARWLGITPEQMTSVIDAVEETSDWDQQNGRDVDLTLRLTRIAERIGRKTELTDLASVMHEVEEAFEKFPPSLLEGDVTLRTVHGLRAEGRDIRIASNTGFASGASVRSLLARTGILEAVSTAVFSDAAGVSKPHPGMFHLVAGDDPPCRILHIGDDPVTDYGGATRFGMKALLLRARGDANTYAENFRVISSVGALLSNPRLLGPPQE